MSHFTPKPMTSCRSSRKTSSYLVRAKLYPINRTAGFYNCGSKRCEVCKYITETNTFTSTVTGEIFKTNQGFDCNDKCLVFLMTCNKCKKEYTGQTVDHLRSRWNNYKSKSRTFDREEQCMQKHLYKHFESQRHSGFCDNVSVKLIDKTDGVIRDGLHLRKVDGSSSAWEYHLPMQPYGNIYIIPSQIYQ